MDRVFVWAYTIDNQYIDKRLYSSSVPIAPPDSPERAVAYHLSNVGNAFIQAQQRRNEADYNTAKECTPIEVELQIREVTEAFPELEHDPQ